MKIKSKIWKFIDTINTLLDLHIRKFKKPSLIKLKLKNNTQISPTEAKINLNENLSSQTDEIKCG